LSADGSKLLVSSNADQTALQYDVQTGEAIDFKFTEAINATQLTGISSVVFTVDGKFYVAGAPDGSVIDVNIDSGAVSQRYGIHNVELQALMCSPDGTRLAYVSADKRIRLWNAKHVLIATLQGHTDQITGIAFSRDGKRLASSSVDKTARIWDVQN